MSSLLEAAPPGGPIDWDVWRSRYHVATFADQAGFCEAVWRLHPEQRHWDLAALERALTVTGDDLRVVEIGGWDGALAASVLANHPAMRSWTNLDLCEPVRARPVCSDPRYSAPALHAHVWEDPDQAPGCDLLVATHVMEHLSLAHAAAVVRAVAPTRWLWVETPLGDAATDWGGYLGSHVIEVGWAGLDQAFTEDGWRECLRPTAIARLYGRAATGFPGE